MSTMPIDSPDRPVRRNYLFGSFYKLRDPARNTFVFRINAFRLLLVAGIALSLIYTVGVAVSYVWLSRGRGLEQIQILDVALFRVKKVRSGVGAQQFVQAKLEWDRKEYQKAYLSFRSALRNAPEEVEGRLSAVAFFEAIGAVDLAAEALGEGLSRQPENRVLIVRTFDLLLATGRDRRALALLHGRFSASMAGGNALLLRRYELQATLSADGPDAARNLLDNHIELLKDKDAGLVVARVLWENKQGLKALDMADSYTSTHPEDMEGFVFLADHQMAAGLVAEARVTAMNVRRNHSQDIIARILTLSILSGRGPDERALQDEMRMYLEDFGNRPEALLRLGAFAGKKGWIDVTRSLYELTATQMGNCRMQALFYGDALMQNQRYREARELFANLEQQSQGDADFSLQLWQRQVAVAALVGDHDAVREAARRIATVLKRDPDKLEIYREHFAKMPIPEAVAELGGLSPKPVSQPARKS